MNVIVGKMWAVLAVVLCMPVYAQVTLRVESMNGLALRHASVGYPFCLAVTVNSDTADMQWPEIDGLQMFEIIGRQKHMQIVGAEKTVTYAYQVLAHEPGTHILGPARNGQEVSNTATLEVKDVSSVSQTSASHTEPVMVRLRTDKQRIVVGEKIRCTLTFLSSDEKIRLEQIVEPRFDGWHCQAAHEPVESMQNVNGVPYHAVSWSWDVCPTTDGIVTIPACRMAYKVPVQGSSHGSALSAFFGKRYNHKRAYSNAVKIIIDPLPEYEGPVSGVGAFDRFSASITPAVARQGQGMTLKLAVEGDGAFDQIAMPILSGLPDACRHYPSKQFVEADAGQPAKHFEYIVQGLEPGEWTIPAQTFTFFDVRTRTYKTLQSSPLLINVLEDAEYAASLECHEEESLDEPKEDVSLAQEVDVAVDILPLHENGPWYHRQQRFIPWWLFGLILVLSLGWLSRGAVMYALRCLIAPHQERVHYSRAFAHARSALQQAHKKNDHKKVYGVFIQLFAVRSGQNASVLSHEKIDDVLKRAGMVQENRMQWYHFFTTAAECVFYPRAHRSTATLFDDAYAWLARLEKIL